MDHEHDEQAARIERGEDSEADFIRFDRNEVKDLEVEGKSLDDLAGGAGDGPRGGHGGGA